MAMFQTPEQVRAAETRQRMATNPAAAVTGSLFNLGNVAANAGMRGIGEHMGNPIETRSHEEIKAGLVQQQLKGLDFSSRESVFSTAKQLKDKGHFAEAAQVLSMMPDLPPVGPDQYGEPVEKYREVSIDGKTAREKYWAQQNLTTGKWSELGSTNVTSSDPTTDPNSTMLVDDWTIGEFTFQPEERKLISKTFVDEANKANSYFNPDAEDMNQDGIAARVGIMVAERMKSDQMKVMDAAAKAAYNPETGVMNMTTYKNLVRLGKSTFTPRRKYVDMVMNDIKDSGTMSDFIERNDVFSDTTNLNTDSSIPSPAELDRLKEVNAKIRAGEIENKKMRDAFIRGNPELGELNLKGVDLETGVKAFQAFGEFEDEDILRGMRQFGISYGSGEAMQTHKLHWSWMRSQPEYTSAWMGARDARTRRNLTYKTLERLAREGNVEEWHRVKNINEYLSRMQTAKPLSTPDKVDQMRADPFQRGDADGEQSEAGMNFYNWVTDTFGWGGP